MKMQLAVGGGFNEDGQGFAVPQTQVAPCHGPFEVQMHRVTCQVPPPPPELAAQLPLDVS